MGLLPLICNNYQLTYRTFQIKDEVKIGENINLFWEEFDQFCQRKGVFANREHIWNSSDVLKGNAHLWHYRNSFRYTEILGKLACRVTSKILGIGSAERSWGDVKHLKTNKRSHLSGDRTKKQATIYGAYCMEKANVKRNLSEKTTKNPYKFWTNDDFDREFDMLTENKEEIEDKNVRLFRSWKEEWEDEAVENRSPVNEAKLLEKYGGLQWWDLDHNQLVYSDPTDLKWTKQRGRGSFYCVITYDEKYEKDADDREEHVEPWEFSDDLRESIADYYSTNTTLGVKVVYLDKSDMEQQTNETTSKEDNEDQFR